MASWPYNTTTWKWLRLAKLADEPLCEVCIRREVVTIADTVDHIVEINDGGEPFPPLTGLMSMCAACHNTKGAAVRFGRSARFKGCDVNGNPIDPEDGWYAPGGFEGRKTNAAGPAGETRTELVANDSQLEVDRWV